MESMYTRIANTCMVRGITPSGLCIKVGVRKSLMSDLKSGRTSSMRTDTLLALARELQVSTDYLLTGVETSLTEEESVLLRCWRLSSDTVRQNVAFALRDYGMPMPEPRHKKEEAG